MDQFILKYLLFSLLGQQQLQQQQQKVIYIYIYIYIFEFYLMSLNKWNGIRFFKISCLLKNIYLRHYYIKS